MDELSAQRLAFILFDSEDTTHGTGFPSIPGYAIDELLGQGGGGDVFGGTVVSTGRPVAIKLLHAHLKLSARESFRELDHLASIRSSAVPHLLDYGWHGNQIYIVTERIMGENPLQFAKGLSIKNRVKLLARISDAVSKLHARGVLHRDIKPSNILVTDDGTPVILDLGISSLASETNSEPDGVTRGTGQYMCPEQAAGQNSEATTTWDVYALGVLGIEVMLGERVPPRFDWDDISGKLPRRLRPILRKAVATTADQRYETAQQLRDDLEAWIHHQPIQAEHARLWSRMLRIFTARPVFAITCLCILIVVSSVFASTLFVMWQNTKPYRFETVRNSAGSTILTLFALNGRVLHTWQVDKTDAINYKNQLVRHNGRNLAVIGLRAEDIYTGHQGLVVYEVGAWDEPLWVAEQRVLPEMAHVTRFESPPHTFHHLKHYLFDVFPSNPGDEIVSLHRHSPSSLCAIQIHSLEGELLSEYYHDGWLKSAAWLPNQGKLVLAGQNSDGTWLERGEATLPAGKYPMIVLAITPVLGSVGNTIEHPGHGVGTPADWYRCLTPTDAYEPFHVGATSPLHSIRISPKPHEAEQGITNWQLGGAISTTEQLGHSTLVIDAHGRKIDAWKTDNWNGSTDYGLTEGVYQLSDLPPRTKAREYEPMQPPSTSPADTEP